MQEAADKLNNFLKGKVLTHQLKTIMEGTVTAVADNNCTVQIDDGPELLNVRLQAIEDSVSSFIRIQPTVNSVVLVGMIENTESEFAVLQCSEIDEVWINISGVEYKINADGHLIKKGSDEMWDALSLLFDSLQQIIILKGRNPDWIKFAQSKEKFKNIFNGT